ncbi:MAG: trypsin-like peptidase domain-containing protein [Planctomycetota bacterium]|nr:trypsin-like peptidase domain-containing protein [Planctomycetota bacterium]
MSERASLHRTVFLSIVIGVVVGVVVAKAMDGWPAARAAGEETQGKRQFTEQAETFRQAAKQIAPSVVAITSLKKVQKIEGYTFEKRRDLLGFPRYYRLPKYAESQEPIGVGSGFIFDEKNGYILTNNHVVAEGEEFIVKLHDKRELSAKVVGTDPQTDVAVLKIEAQNLTGASLGDSDAVAVGDWVLAAGNPFGLLEQTITAGIISAKGRRNLHLNNYEDFLQTDAAINQGNSGGPLVNLNGEVVGINTAIFSKTGGYQGIGFAIPINQAKNIASKLVKDGYVPRGWLGIELQGIAADKAKRLGLEEGVGLEVKGVHTKGPAYEAGLWPGDILLTLNDKEIRIGNDLNTLIPDMEPGAKVTLKILHPDQRKYVPMTKEVTLGVQPKDWGIKKDEDR